MRNVATEVTVNWCRSEDKLYRHYQGQYRPQSAYVELNLETGWLSADYNAEIGNAVPMDVYHGRALRFKLPVIPTGSAADELLEAATEFAQGILDGASIEWNGNNMVGRFDADAEKAADNLRELIEDWDFGAEIYGD